MRKENKELKQVNRKLNVNIATQQLKLMKNEIQIVESNKMIVKKEYIETVEIKDSNSRNQPQKIIYKCDLCEKVFIQKANHEAHISTNQGFSSKDCENKFESNLHLTAHIETMHKAGFEVVKRF